MSHVTCASHHHRRTCVPLQDITVLNIFNGSLIAEAVVERFSAAKLFGSSGLAQLRGAAVPVAG